MRVLVTGGAGMVGSHIAEFYAGRGDEVVILDNLIRSTYFKSDKKSVEYNWNYLGKLKNINRIQGDVREKKDVQKAIGKGVDIVVHAAAQPGVGFSIENPEEDYSNNAFGTFNVLECIRKKSKDACFIYTSTNKVYGHNVNRISLGENEKRYCFVDCKGVSENIPIDLTEHTPYGVSKYVGDMYVQEYGHIYGMKTSVFRMSCIYGKRQFGFEDQGWVAWFVIRFVLGKDITIYGDGKQVRDMLYVDDLVSAFDKFVASDIGSQVFNIGGGEKNTFSLLEMIEFLKNEFKAAPEIKISDWRPSDQKVYISDITKIKDLLGWEPKVSPEEGVRKLIEWAKENKGLF